MLELLGVGVPRPDGGWLLHRVCIRLDAPGFVLVTSERAEERQALLDVMTGRLLPVEGRVWVDGIPSMKGMSGRIRDLVADVEVPPLLAYHRSILWNVLAGQCSAFDRLAPLMRFPRRTRRGAALRALERVGFGGRLCEPVSGLDMEGAARLALARALMRSPRNIVLREPDRGLAVADLEAFLGRTAALAQAERLTVIVSLARPGLARSLSGGRVVALADGLLVFDGPLADPEHQSGWPGGHPAPRAARVKV